MSVLRQRPPTIAFLLGKPVRADTIFPDIFERLSSLPVKLSVHLPIKEPLPATLREADLVVQRGLDGDDLTALRWIEDAGVRCCNPIDATAMLGDRLVTLDTLSAAGLPVPLTTPLETWPEVVSLADSQSIVVKAVDGRVGRSVGVLIAEAGQLVSQPPFAGPYIVQEFIRNDGRVHKAYVAGQQARGMMKRSSPDAAVSQPGLSTSLAPELVELALQAGAALGLDIYGVDFLYGPDPVIIDVNPFPGFRGVPDAADLISTHLARLATDRMDAARLP